MRAAWFAVAVCLISSSAALDGQDQSSARIYGLILDQEGRRPIPEVHVSLAPGDIATSTSASGRFVLQQIPYGRYVIRFERLGYLPRVDTLEVGPGLPLDIKLHLATSPIPLEPIQVVVRSEALRRAGFYDRRDFQLHGTFFTEEDIERLAPQELTDLMRRAPSTIVVFGGLGRTLVRFNRQVGMSGNLPGCEPAVFLDGSLIQDQLSPPRLLDFNRVRPSAVAGIEVYVGVNTPIEYKRNPCGTVLIWTRKGG